MHMFVILNFLLNLPKVPWTPGSLAVWAGIHVLLWVSASKS